MTSAQAKGWVVTAIGVAAATTVVSDLSHGRFIEGTRLRIGIGALFAAIVLTLVAEGAPEVATGLAATIALGAILANGSVFITVSKLLG